MKEHQTIFSVKELKSKIKNAFVDGIPNKNEKIKIIENWQENILSGKAKNSTEQELKPIFLTQFFGEILGYEYKNANNWNLRLENKSELDSTKADAALGFFSIDSTLPKFETLAKFKSDVRAVIEIKNGRTTLDKPQNRPDFKGSPVEQCFMYAAKSGEKCKWVIVSNFLEIRLYLATDMTKYESFDILKLNEEFEFSRFYYLLSNEQLFFETISSTIDNLLTNRIEKEKTITTEFYEEYRYLREVFLQHLKLHNPDKNPLDLLQYAQTIIDRIIFVSVIKDYDLIHYTVLKEIEEISAKSWADDNSELWEQLKKFFRALDKGLPPRIHKFNGGLFKRNEIIETLKIKDLFLKQLLKLSNYDFESDLNVNVLGHIFEQSITDIETLKKDISENKQIEYSETEEVINYKIQSIEINKRKKDGIYYTPENITQYIVNNTIGNWLNDKKNELGINNLSDFPKNEDEQKFHIQLWEKYADLLKNIKILDPACGSGAFLTQAFDFLLKEWLIIFDVLDKLKIKNDKFKIKTKVGLFKNESDELQKQISKIKKDIVNNNLFGVDLNYESVEITKLGLWLKSTSKNDALALLDNNIKCGNSLISDKEISEKAFVWETEFKEIMENGGFDIIVGNPPYVDSKNLKPYSEYFSKNYKTYNGTADLYVYFYEVSLNILNKNGILGFISSNKFMKTGYGENLRKLLSQKNILQILDFTDFKVFQDALVASSILIVKNQELKEDIKISFVNKNLNNYNLVEEYVKENHFYTKSSNLDEKIWFLSANGKLPLKRKIEDNKTKLKDIEGVAIFRGVTTGYNEAFIIDEDTKKQLINEDNKNAEIIKPLLQGRNIRKWFYNESGKYMIFVPWHFPLHKDSTITGASSKSENEFKNNYKSLYNHLLKFKNSLQKRNIEETGVRYEWYAMQRCAATYYPEFEKPKIIWGLTADKWAYCFDNKGHFLPSNGYILTSEKLALKYILGILNSKLMHFYFNFIGIMTAGGAFTLKYDTIAEFPIKIITETEQQLIIQRVDEIIELHKNIQENRNKLLNRINQNFNLKSTTKLSEIYNYNFKILIEELKKQNIILSLNQQDEWNLYFNENKNKIVQNIDKAKQIEKQIDKLVYEIYNLTKEEIEIIEKPKKMDSKI